MQITRETEKTASAAPASRDAGRRRRSLFAGGTEGNEELTAITGVILILLLAALGVTILRIRQLISIHLFLGLLLIGPVLLKMASTGYRFMRYYTNNPAYRKKGPPELALRLMAPLVVFTTLVVFISGVVLLFVGPAHRGSLVAIHKVSFIVWLVFIGLHILGHLPGLGGALRAAPRGGDGRHIGGAGRWISISGALVAGLVLAVVLIPQFGIWANHFPHHHH